MIRFISAAIVGFLAAAAVYAAKWSGIPLWVMFFGWIGFFINYPTMRRVAFGAAHNVIGLGLAVLTANAIIAFNGVAGEAAMAVVVFILATGLILLEGAPPFDNVPAYFMGLSVFFASGLEPSFASIVTLSGGVIAGYFLGFATIELRGRWRRSTNAE